MPASSSVFASASSSSSSNPPSPERDKDRERKTATTAAEPVTPSRGNRRAESPTQHLLSPSTRQRVSSPAFNRRGSPSLVSTPPPTAASGLARPGSRGSLRATSTGASAPSTPSREAGSEAAAALSSLQELIRTMPAPTPPQSQAGAAAGGGGITSEGQRVASPSPAPVPTNGSVNSSSSSTTGSSTGSSTAVGPLAAAAASASARKASASMSTLNPNAGGFQPGALSSLGEVDNEHLITPMASNFDLNAHQQMPQPHHYQQQHSANSGNPLNVFGSPLSTPQHQTGAAHYANPQDWQNYHNVFNAGIGNPTGAGGSPSSSASATDSAINPQLAAFAAAMGVGVGPAGIGGSFDFTNNANLAAMMAIANGFSAGGNVNSNTGNGSNAQMQNQLAALQALQQQQQIAAALGGGGGGGPGSAQTAIPFQQFGSPSQQQQQQQQLFNLQQQQLQLQALLAAQMQAQTQVQQPYASHQGPSTPNSRENANVPPRFVQSGSQPDLASMLAGNTGLGNTASPGGAAGGFMAEQLALQAQYEALRQQQNELLKRFSEMQLQAQQLAMAQASQQQQQQGSSPGVMSPQSQAGTIQGAGNQHVSAPAPASQSPSVSRQQAPHRRGPSQSISGIGSNNPASAAFTSGPMGQFGSMGQFTLPSQSSTNSPGAAQSQAPKGHGRRHSVNVTKRDPNLNTSFSFPNALGGSLGSASPAGGMSADNSFAINTSAIQEANENASTEAAQVLVGRAHGHGRRESRGSIGSLAGWGTNSNIVTQSSVPVTQTNVTDLAQAQAQLQQLSQFRASAGHSRVPSFGMQQLQSTPTGGNQQQRKSLFAPYLPAASIPPLLQTGKLVIGTLRVNKRNRSDAYVATDVLDADVFICGSKDRNRALEGDVVAVELLDVDEVWGTKKEKEEKKRKKEESNAFDPKFQQQLRRQDKKKDDVEVEGQGLTLFEDEEVSDEVKPLYAGHVVAVVERQAGQLFAGTLGILRPSSAATKEKQDAERRERDGIDIRPDDRQNNRPKIIWFKPVDKRVPLVAIPADQAPEGFLDHPDQYNSTLFVACIKRWPITSLHPFGSLVEELGEIGNIEAETNALLKDSGFTEEIFTENVVKCLPPVPWSIPQTEVEARKDFRQCRVFTIDPETARDLDDALHVNKLDDGTFEVGVHIADVSHFVKPNTPLDREARRRATTVYLVQRASPMLPQTLCESLCSLQPGEERLTFSAVFKMSEDGRVLSTWFGKSVIKSAAKLSYGHAQTVIEGAKLPETVKIYDDHDPEGIAGDIKLLDTMARQMRGRRFENGALRIDNVKLSFSLDEDGRPEDCKVYQRQESHSLIEEFMLLANQAVAQKIAASLPDQAFLRRHEAPIARRLEGFEKRASRLGFEMDISSAGALMTSFKKLTDDDPELVLRMLATKSMLQAKYICAGMFDIAQYHHYALNAPIYTHFTSPIRRYADVIVHRQLEAALTDNPEARFVMDAEAVSKVAQHCNVKKAAAKLAQEASQHLFLCTLISDLTQKYGPVMRQASVISVLDQAFDVVVPDFGIEKRVHVDQMPIENHVHDERGNTLQLYWKKGVDVIRFLAENSGDPHVQRVKATAEQHARLMEASSRSNDAEKALFDDDDDDAAEPESERVPVAPATKGVSSSQKQKSVDRATATFEAIEETAAGHCIQTIKELQKVPVIVSADLTVCPPVIKVFAVNPFV